MKTYTVNGHIEPDGHLKLDLATDLPESDAEITVLVHPKSGPQKSTDFRSFEGILGTKLWMSDDFDAPLDDFQEYMG